MVFVRRLALESILGEDRVLLFGRRKTGKTFYVVKRKPDWRYFLVRRDGRFWDPKRNRVYDVNTFLEIWDEKTVVDEFHRAPPELFYAIQAQNAPEKLILITSTVHYFRRFVHGPEAPLKGLFYENAVGLISPLDLLRYPWEHVSLDEIILYQEPVFVGGALENILSVAPLFVESLSSEILREEDLSHSERHRAIMQAIAAGNTTVKYIADYLYSQRIIKTPETGHVTKYLRELIAAGMVEQVGIYGKKRSMYRLSSPLFDLVLYTDDRYSIFDQGGASLLKRVWRERRGIYFERFAERFFSELYGLKPVKILRPEVDIALTRFKRLVLIGEVKWRARIPQREVRRIEEKLHNVEKRFGDVERKVLVVPDASAVPETDLEVWDLERMREAAEAIDQVISTPPGGKRERTS